jgi:hypothetical protein
MDYNIVKNRPIFVITNKTSFVGSLKTNGFNFNFLKFLGNFEIKNSKKL